MRRRVSSLLSAGLLLLVPGLVVPASADSPRSSREARHSVAPEGALVDSPEGALVDLALGETAPTSREVALERLGLIGVDADTAGILLGEADAAREFGVDVEEVDFHSALSPVALEPWAESKGVALLRAYLAGEPIALVGLSVSPDEAASVGSLRAAGLDPDAAAWLVLKSREIQGAGEPSLLAGLVERASAEPQQQDAALGVMGGLANLRRGISLPEGQDLSPVAPNAFCRTCPSVDALLTPSTTYRTTSATLRPGDCRMYRMTVAAGRQYRFTFCEGGGNAVFDTALTAWGTQCQFIASNDDSCGTRSQLDVSTSAAGYIYLRVSDNTGTGGAFTLAYKDNGPSPSGCSSCPTFNFGTYTPNQNWQTHSSSIASGGCKIYRFQMFLNRSYEFSTCDGGGTAGFDTRIETFTGNCVAGPANDDACFSGGSTVNLTANASQYLYVKVSGVGGGSGNYTLAYRETTGQCQTCPSWNHGTFTPTTSWANHNGTVTSGGCQLYRFAVKSHEQYVFTFCEGGGTANFDTTLEAFSYDGSNCVSIASDDDSCGVASHLVVNPGYTGYLYVRVGGFGGAAGAYTLAFTKHGQTGCTPPDFGPLTPLSGVYSTHSGIVPRNGDRVYSFNLTAGEGYVFIFCATGPGMIPTGGSATFDTRLRLGDENCNLLAANDDFCGVFSRIVYAAITTGVHYLQVRASGPGGGYTLAYAEAP